MGRKLGGCAPLGERARAETYLRTNWYLDLSSRLAKTDMAMPLRGGSWSPPNSLACTDAYLRAKFRPDPFNRSAAMHQRYR